MKLILINLYSTESIARYLLSSYTLKAYLDKFFGNNKDIFTEVLNFNVKTEPFEICEEIIKYNPDWIGYSCYIWNVEKIIDIIKILKNRTNYVHILGGPEISLNMIKRRPELATADYCIIGGGEKILANLLIYLKAIRNKDAGAGAEVPKGVAYWSNGKINYNKATDKITNLDEIPSVYLNGILDERLYAGRQAFMETQRGCRYKCKYCVYHKDLPLIYYYSLQRVFEELDYLIIKKQIRALRIFDAIFTSNLARAKKIVEHIIKIKEKNIAHLPWIYWEFNYNGVDEEFIRLAASLRYREKISNAKEIPSLDRPQLYSDMLKDYTAINCIGIQSFNSKSLIAVGRASPSLEALKNFMDMAKEYNIVLKIDLILGLPLETFDSYFEGLEFFLPFFKDTDHILNIHRLQILPGSDLETTCNNYGVKYSLKAPHLVFSTQDFSEKDMDHASKLTAILFRILNSPLRQYFFEFKEKTEKSFYEVIDDIFNMMASSQTFKKTRLIQDKYVDDIYWNDDIFREIPSEWLIGLFKDVKNI